MAFPLPTHLPRQGIPQNKSSDILSKVGEATRKSLNSELASKWVLQAAGAVKETKEAVYSLLQTTSSPFEQQQSTSVSARLRLTELLQKAQRLQDSLTDPQSGSLQVLQRTVQLHDEIASEADNAEKLHTSLAYLLRVKAQISSLMALVQSGKLPAASRLCSSLQILIDEPPTALGQASVFKDIQNTFRVLKDNIQEQLIDAQHRSLYVGPDRLAVQTSTTISCTSEILQLSETLQHLSPIFMNSQLSTFRRNLSSFIILPLISGRVTCREDQETGHLIIKPPEQVVTEPASRLDWLQTVADYLSKRLVASLPASLRRSFCESLFGDFVNPLLRDLLADLPTSLTALPAFLQLTKKALRLEEALCVLLDLEAPRKLQSWVENLPAHYEKNRRRQILAATRDLVQKSHVMDDVAVEFSQPMSAKEITSPLKQDDEAWQLGPQLERAAENDGWGFEAEDDVPAERSVTPIAQDSLNTSGVPSDGWGWNDDASATVEAEMQAADQGQSSDAIESSDGWGWDEDETKLSTTTPPEASAHTRPTPATYGKEREFSVLLSHEERVRAALTLSKPQPSASSKTSNSYKVSSCARQVLELLIETLREGEEFRSSGSVVVSFWVEMFLQSTSSSSMGSIILETACQVSELFRAVYPIHCRQDLSQSANLRLRFHNDCLYFNDQLRNLDLSSPHRSTDRPMLSAASEQFARAKQAEMKTALELVQRKSQQILAQAHHFSNIADDTRNVMCRRAVESLLEYFILLAGDWKRILLRSLYFESLGAVVDRSLVLIMKDIVGLQDILESESERLVVILQLLNSLEELFHHDAGEDISIFTFVPSWIKFSYLSEILNASLVDISYLVEEGALVDFEVDELVNLVKALFADTPLRAKTIDMILEGKSGLVA